MNCYYHPDRPAVGICKHCQRGLCAEDAAPVDDVLACKGRHEDAVHAANQLAARTILQSERLGSVYSRNAIFYFLVGAVFTGYGLYQVRFTGLQGIFLLVVGLFLIFAAALNFAESRKYK